jgi:hypothetical protein
MFVVNAKGEAVRCVIRRGGVAASGEKASKWLKSQGFKSPKKTGESGKKSVSSKRRRRARKATGSSVSVRGRNGHQVFMHKVW